MLRVTLAGDRYEQKEDHPGHTHYCQRCEVLQSVRKQQSWFDRWKNGHIEYYNTPHLDFAETLHIGYINGVDGRDVVFRILRRQREGREMCALGGKKRG